MSDETPQLTQRARRVLNFAQEAANRLGDSAIDTEHLVLGMIREEVQVTAKFLQALGLDSMQVDMVLHAAGYQPRTDVPIDKPRPLLILDKNGKLLNANEPAQDLLDHHGAELLDGLSRNIGSAIELSIGGRIFLIVSGRVSDTGTMAMLWDTTRFNIIEREVKMFVNDLVHELRPRIMGITLGADLLTKSAQLDEKGELYVDMMVRHAERMDEIIRDLTPLWILSIGISNDFQQPCDLKGLAEEVSTSFNKARPFKPVGIHFDFPAVDCRVLCDEWLLHTMIWKLVKRAIADSTEPKELNIGLSRDADGIWLRVFHRGARIPENELLHIFDNQSGRSYEVSGFSAVKTIIEAHGGTVEARNLPTGGVEFIVLFPAAIVLPPEG